MQGKWIKIALGAIAVPVVTVGAVTMVRAYENGTTFQPMASNRELAVNRVVFTGEEDTAAQKDNREQDRDGESELWEKDKTAEDASSPNLKNSADYLFQTGSTKLPDGTENINLAGEEAADNTLLPGENTDITGTGNYVYDVTNDTDKADLIIEGNGQGTTAGIDNGNGTSGSTGTGNGSDIGQGETLPTGTPAPAPAEPTKTPMPQPKPQPTARPADTVKDPEPSKPTPGGTTSGIFTDYKFEEDEKYTDDDVLIIGSLNTQEYELYRGQRISALDVFCILDAGVIKASASIPARYLWGEKDLNRYIKIDGISFDKGKTWILASEFPVEIPMDTEEMSIKASYRLTEDGAWKEYQANEIRYAVKTSKVYVLSRKLTKDDSVIPEDCVLNKSDQIFPKEGSYINLYRMQKKYIEQTQPNAAWFGLTELFSHWTENGEPVDWMYQVTAGRHILEPAELNPVPDGYTVWLNDYMVDGEQCPLQTLVSWDDDTLKNGVLDVPNGIQAIEPYSYGDIPRVNSITIPASTMDIDMSSLIVNDAFLVSKENKEYSSNAEGWLLNRSGTELLAVPYQTKEIEVPSTIQKIDLPAFNILEKIMLTAQNQDQIPEIATNGIMDCEIVVPDELIEDFYEKNPIVFNETQNISILSDKGTEYYLENAKIVSKNGDLRRVQQNGSNSVSLTNDIRRIQKGAFASTDGSATANMLILAENGEKVILEDGCFEDSDIKYIQCYTAEQTENVTEQLKKQNITDISVQTVGISTEGFRYAVMDDANQKTTILLKAPTQLKNFDGTVTAQDKTMIKITAIGDNAFSECKDLKWVVLPESVDTIGYEAFCGCTSLEGILINTADSIMIGNRSLEECPSLRFVASNAMHAVRVDDYDPDITDSTNGYSTRSHYFYVLAGAEGYGGNSVYFVNSAAEASNVRKYNLMDLDEKGNYRVLYGFNESAGNWMAVRFGTQVPEKVKLPESTVEIFEHALSGTGSDAEGGAFTLNWSELVKLQFVDDYAFENSGVSGSIRFGSGMKYELGDYAFSGCNKITSVELPGTANKLGVFAFVNCTELNKISYGSMLAGAAVYSDCFDSCNKLTEIHFADGSANLVFSNYVKGSGFYFNYWNVDEGISLIVPTEYQEAYLKKWRYMFAGYATTLFNPAYLEMWQDIQYQKQYYDYDLEKWILPKDEEVDTAVRENLLQAENRLRGMFGMQTVEEPTDFYPYHVDNDGMITLVGVASGITEVRLDAATLELPEGWSLDYVGADAFKNSKKLEKVIFPDTFVGIYSNAFRGVESNSLTLVFEGNKPPALMTETEGEKFSFGIDGSKITVVVPEEARAAYYEAWNKYGVTIAGYSAPATMSVSGGDIKVSVSDGDARQSVSDGNAVKQEEIIQ